VYASQSATVSLLGVCDLVVAMTYLLPIRVDLSLERSGKVLVDSVSRGGKVLQNHLNGGELSIVKRGVVAVAKSSRFRPSNLTADGSNPY
jgi:hypothetical protein